LKAIYYFKRAISLPPHVVLQKIIHKLKNKYAAKKKKILDEKFPTYVRKCPFSSLNRYLHNVNPCLSSEEIVEFAAHCLKHEFDLLGSGWTQVFHGMNCKGLEKYHYPPRNISTDQEGRWLQGRINEQNLPEAQRIWRLIEQPYTPIDWHLDFKSGYRWNESTWSQNIQYGTQPGVDVKVPWELARMQHLVSLAWSYKLEKNTEIVREFTNQIIDFIATNPPRYGVNWSCTMDVGIRIANWLLAYDLFCSFGAKFSPEFEAILIRSVYEHGRHIISHLEWDPHLRSNHYLANIVGLLFVAAYLPKNPEVKSWLQFALRELEKEVIIQFHPDGSNFEGSTSYHRLSAEMVVYATALAHELNISFSASYMQRIEKMGQFIADITKPDGTIVQFGDNDSGRFIRIFPDPEGLDHRYLIGGIQSIQNLSSVLEGQFKATPERKMGLKSYPDFGLYIQDKEPWYLAVRCGSIGQKGNGGHAHNDQLSFELAVHGISMIIDPGTYVYTPLPNSRRHFRSTSMHNTLSNQGKEQNQDEGLFRMTDKAHARVLQFKENLFIGEHDGLGSTSRRTMKISDNCIEGIDEFEKGEKQIYFHFHPDWKGMKVNEKETEWTCQLHKIRMTTDHGVFHIRMDEYSRAYGEKQVAPVLVLETLSKRVVWKIEV